MVIEFRFSFRYKSDSLFRGSFERFAAFSSEPLPALKRPETEGETMTDALFWTFIGPLWYGAKLIWNCALPIAVCWSWTFTLNVYWCVNVVGLRKSCSVNCSWFVLCMLCLLLDGFLFMIGAVWSFFSCSISSRAIDAIYRGERARLWSKLVESRYVSEVSLLVEIGIGELNKLIVVCGIKGGFFSF